MSYLDQYKVTVPEAKIGNWAIERFTIEGHKTMRRRFGQRSRWQACWAEHHVKRMR